MNLLVHLSNKAMDLPKQYISYLFERDKSYLFERDKWNIFANMNKNESLQMSSF